MSNFWTSSLQDTVRTSERFVQSKRRRDHVSEWLSKYVDDGPTSSNQGVSDVPFQRWFKFKEAFSPKFVIDTLGSLKYDVNRCLDPFGGSGTTALTCRMLGVQSVTTEVNPFLADLIKTKLTRIDGEKFADDSQALLSSLRVTQKDMELPEGFPPTLTEPGSQGRYIFPAEVFGTIQAILRRIQLWHPDYARLLKVLLGSVLIENSNVRINGKGRRYRSNWEQGQKTRSDLIHSLRRAIDFAVKDLTDFAGVPLGNHRVLLGDTREKLASVRSADIAIFSPPYPNSFDYTDVYNVELWALGYLSDFAANRRLRQQTLRSHVQTRWITKSPIAAASPQLSATIEALEENRDKLWDAHIPMMIQFYFDDLLNLFIQLQRIIPLGHHAVIAIGDSQYANVMIDVSVILPEVVSIAGFRVENMGAIRSMRNSSQHGGKFSLSEHCIVFRRVA